MTVATTLPVLGFSVTIPHKQRILRYLDVIEPLAKRIGAVNTVWRKTGKWRGTNTDVEGILKPLGRHLRLAHAQVLIAGYGGAARAAAFALSDAGASLTITGRDLKSAQALARVINAEVSTLAQVQKQQYDALIHATSVGMFPNANECLFHDAIPADLVFDMVYNPHETLLLKRAKEQGCTVIPGSEMLLGTSGLPIRNLDRRIRPARRSCETPSNKSVVGCTATLDFSPIAHDSLYNVRMRITRRQWTA